MSHLDIVHYWKHELLVVMTIQQDLVQQTMLVLWKHEEKLVLENSTVELYETKTLVMRIVVNGILLEENVLIQQHLPVVRIQQQLVLQAMVVLLNPLPSVQVLLMK